MLPDDEPALSVNLLDKGIDLLIRAIKKNLMERQNSQFSSQLLHMTINFVNNLMKESVKDRATSGPSLEQLNQYMLQLRDCLVDIPKHMLDLEQCNDLMSHFGLSRKNTAMWSDLSREVSTIATNVIILEYTILGGVKRCFVKGMLA